jgi:hypothetical protein
VQPQPPTKLVEDVPQDAGLRPAGEIPEHGAPGDTEVCGQRAPFRPVAGDVADGVDDPPTGSLLRSPALRGPAGGSGQEPFRKCPFEVARVGGER